MERIMFENNQNIRSHIGMLLRDQPVGRTADLLDYTVAYWDGHQVVGMRTRLDRWTKSSSSPMTSLLRSLML